MSGRVLHEQFAGPGLDERLEWLDSPARHCIDSSGLVVEPNAPTDFWQRTHYGFQADTGHFLGMKVTGDFVVSTEVRFHPVHQYDQAGLMIR